MLYLDLYRHKLGQNSTLGTLVYEDNYVCHTLEPHAYLPKDATPETIRKEKKLHKTAIPSGLYEIDMDTISPVYGKREFFIDTCEGKVPRLKDVPGFLGVLIHTGNTCKDTKGCILVGEEYDKVDNDFVLFNSRKAFKRLYELLAREKKNDGRIFLTVHDK